MYNSLVFNCLNVRQENLHGQHDHITIIQEFQLSANVPLISSKSNADEYYNPNYSAELGDRNDKAWCVRHHKESFNLGCGLDGNLFHGSLAVIDKR